MSLPASAREYLPWMGQVLNYQYGKLEKYRRLHHPFEATPGTLEARAQAAVREAKTPEESRMIARLWLEAAIGRTGNWFFHRFAPDEADPQSRYDLAMGMYWLARGLNRRLYCEEIFLLRLGAEMLFADPEVTMLVSPSVRDANLRHTLLHSVALAGSTHFITDTTSIRAVMDGVRNSGIADAQGSLEQVIEQITNVSPDTGGILKEMYRETSD